MKPIAPRAGRTRRTLLLAFAAVFAGPALAQGDAKACAIVLLPDAGGSAQSLAALARKLQPACAAKGIDMPWTRSAKDKALADGWKDVARHVKDLRQQGYRRVLVAGVGFGANAVLAYSGAVGEADGVIALAPLAQATGLGDLPATAAGMRGHIPALWVIGNADPLFERGEAFAYAKAPPHPASSYTVVKADHKGTPEAGVKALLEWVKGLE